jgi:antitoxin ParD1/3/4
MATKTMNISLPGELKQFIDSRVRSGLYGNASDVVRAGLRALAREEIGPSITRFEEIMADLPQEPLTPEIEQDIERLVRSSRARDRRKSGS